MSELPESRTPPSNMLKKVNLSTIQAWANVRSDRIFKTTLRAGEPIRPTYLESYALAAPPVISASQFVPPTLVEHLMRNKKDRALGVKFQPEKSDRITNMEGAMHTFVTPIALVAMHGDYVYDDYHHVQRFPDSADGFQTARMVALSAMVQPDFENRQVMLAVSALNDKTFQGTELSADFVIPSVEDKQIPALQEAYDQSLRSHIVANLVGRRCLPSLAEAKDRTISRDTAKILLEQLIIFDRVLPSRTECCDNFVKLRRGDVVSLELLLASALEQARNELSALEVLCPQGYVYTFNPPSIFAREIGADLLNRLQFLALKYISAEEHLANMRVYAFSDYADEEAIPLLKHALSNQPHVAVMSKATLELERPGSEGLYKAPNGAGGALLVIHNNSDGFGQNIQTEGSGGSLDGAIGNYSSAAASLHRQHPNLLSQMI